MLHYDSGVAGAATTALIFAAPFVGFSIADRRKARLARLARLDRERTQWRQDWLADERIDLAAAIGSRPRDLEVPA